MGLFLGANDPMVFRSPEIEKLSTMQQIKMTWKQMGSQSVRYAKNFGGVGALYMAIECPVEKFRGKSDITNSVVAGCAAGGLLACRGGPMATVFGCASFGAFSGAIEYYQSHSSMP
eukprot:TRINITY_DN47619_c0_g1_i1.p1 TRINITY_DN47619_c0_g1~~TRINITY_DN47619_c0_g1_i1.p1  ORF type:complete len:116 (+),score=9.65 TRINITY_DN47619_c0_g1_i1:116-463(+)